MENNNAKKPTVDSPTKELITESLNIMLPDAIVEPKLIDELESALRELATKEVIQN
jgi:hypothetical protein